MITIQEIHAYQKLVNLNSAIPIICVSDPDHGKMIPHMNGEDPCFICLACDSKLHPGLKMQEAIRKTIAI